MPRTAHRRAALALIASLPETISARVRRRCIDGGVVPLQGQREALEALALAGAVGIAWREGPGVQIASAARAPPGAYGPVYSLERNGGQSGAGAVRRDDPAGQAGRPPAPPRRRSWDFPSSSRPSAPIWSTRPKWAASCSMSARGRRDARPPRSA